MFLSKPHIELMGKLSPARRLGLLQGKVGPATVEAGWKPSCPPRILPLPIILRRVLPLFAQRKYLLKVFYIPLKILNSFRYAFRNIFVEIKKT